MTVESYAQAQEALPEVEYGAEPTLLLLADSDSGLERLSRLAGEAGCRIRQAVRTDALPDGRIVTADALVLAMEEDRGSALDALLDRVAVAASERRQRCILAAPLQLIDAVFARGRSHEHRDSVRAR